MNALEVDLNLFKVLDVLFEEGSVSKAAVRLKVSQPAVSAALRRLREQFSDELFVRSAGGLVPTKYAESLKEPVHKAIALVENEILLARNFDPSTAAMTFRIATSDLGETMLFSNLHRYLGKYAPNCAVSSVSLPPDMLMKAMAQGEVDLAVGYFPDLAANGIHERRLMPLPLACLVRSGQPFAGKSIDLETFQELGHVVVGHESRKIDPYEQLVTKMGLKRKIKVELANMISLPPLIATSDLITVAPAVIADVYPGIARVELPFELPALEIKTYWHHRANGDAAIMWLRSCISNIN